MMGTTDLLDCNRHTCSKDGQTATALICPKPKDCLEKQKTLLFFFCQQIARNARDSSQKLKVHELVEEGKKEA